jgi:hypothetical protein
MKVRSNKVQREYSADDLMLNVASSLVRDFRETVPDYQPCSDFSRALRAKVIADVRATTPSEQRGMDIANFKATYQIASLLKRYRFQKDLFSDDELREKAIADFHATQTRLAGIDLSSVSTTTNRILDHAAGYIAKILGLYDDATHRSLCRFGRRASVGIPARLANEAARWELPISGSLEQIIWFDEEMSQIECVQDYWAAQKSRDSYESTYQVTNSLTLTLVPKTYKALRSIMPNTTIGSYMSFGLGEMIRKALKRRGYDIRTLQERHRYLARCGSKSGDLVTADLSSASDSISVALVHRLFPFDWLNILDQSRIGYVMLPDNTRVQSLTYCTMGIGYTFPLQTLVFLALLKAIEHAHYHRRGKRTISVYGDDMIYPSAMHGDVVRVFGEIGFVINLDKTFHEGDFRESCGGDYYRGVDVRPFQPRNGSATVGPKAYEAVLYKLVNGLLARWSEYEISGTLDFLTSEIEFVAGTVKRVPCDFPDESGVKCPSLSSYEFLKRAQVAAVKSLGHGLYRFPYLANKSQLTEEARHAPYLWAALGGPRSIIYHHDDGGCLQDTRSSTQCLIDMVVGVRDGESPLITREVKPHMTFRSKITGRRLRRTRTYVTISNTSRIVRQSGVSGFETRR